MLDRTSPTDRARAALEDALAERRRVQAALRALDVDIHIPTPRAP